MKRQLRKPENWQDFETLCKVLWGEIWNCPEVKKNGRNGQEQHGVDVYGTPKGEQKYYGIQCKGKDDYTKSELSEKEIEQEVEKALNFKPTLKKFYFATTANKDSKIEEYIRLKDQQSRKNGSFEIHLFAWEDIVDLIDENKRAHDWYVDNIGYRKNDSVNVVFNNGQTNIKFKPKLIKNYVKYSLTQINQRQYTSPFHPTENQLRKAKLNNLFDPQPKEYYLNGQTFNLSTSVFFLIITNDGNTPIENFKMYLKFTATGIIVDVVDKRSHFLDSVKYTYNTIMYENSNDCVFEPDEQILVQTDRITTDQICLRPTIEKPQNIVIEYEFVAKNFSKNGSLTIELETEIEEKHSVEESKQKLKDEIRLENCFE